MNKLIKKTQLILERNASISITYKMIQNVLNKYSNL